MPKRKRPRVTEVPDRSLVPLGREARWLADFLRGCGADGAQVPRPGIDPDEMRREWIKGRSLPARSVPMWWLDYVVAILEIIPERTDREPGKQRDPGLDAMEWWRPFTNSDAEAARLTARGEAAGKNVPDDVIEDRAQNLLRKAYRSRKPCSAISKK
jgi:hypothetical protein